MKDVIVRYTCEPNSSVCSWHVIHKDKVVPEDRVTAKNIAILNENAKRISDILESCSHGMIIPGDDVVPPFNLVQPLLKPAPWFSVQCDKCGSVKINEECIDCGRICPCGGKFKIVKT